MSRPLATPVRVRVLRSTSNPLPAYVTVDSAGMDLRAHLDSPLQLAPGARALIPTGLKLEIPRGYEAQIRPRSGLALNSGITVLNAPGTIDADYRGDIGVVLINLSDSSQCIAPGQRVAQLVLAPICQAQLVEVDQLSDTHRSSKGFGSTGLE